MTTPKKHTQASISKTSSSRGEYSLPKQQRLKSPLLIEKVFTKGRSLSLFPLKLIYLEHDTVQVGFVAPKKAFKRAVDRNRIKRLLKEAYRLNRNTIFNNIEGNYALMILYLGKEVPAYPQVENNMVSLLNKFLKKISDEKQV